MFEFVIIGLIVVLIAVLVYAHRRQRVWYWSGNLRRLRAGVNNRAEWMAPEDVIQRVELDYLNAQQWMADALLAGYIRFMNEAPLYLAGSYLKRQQQNALIQMKKSGPRLIGILRAHHHVYIRHFSDDGLICYVLDEQTERRMATYDYWQLRRLHTQDLCDGVYVYRMGFDRSARRWKIEELIQQLPMGWGMQSVASDTIRLQESLPTASGRDI